MPDPYKPELDSFEFTNDEKAAIAQALETEKPWDWKPGGGTEETLKAVKQKIRDLHLKRHGDRCCYCRFPLHGGGRYVIDREHILPKSIEAFRHLAYTIWNLGISCKRCNMQYKGAKVDFVIDAADANAYQESANYRLIHPNYDLYKEHISFQIIANDDGTIVKYTKQPGSEKGPYTYDYFDLKARETNSYDAQQGRDAPEDLGEGALEAQALAREYGQ